MNEFLELNDLTNLKKNYNVISVIGSQSSGKSTLLNNLFGTEFKVMQARNRSQTTKGIFLSNSQNAPVLVLDVEGTDSTERWDDRLFYAKSTGIFALALSQVLVINIWTTSVGNYEGSQLGIIKTIFEMNLKLFGVDQTKTIVLVLRDFNHDVEDLDTIKDKINGDLDKIWKEIKKPLKFENSQPTDLFKIEFVPLSNFVYCKPQFQNEVTVLRNKFEDKENEGYYFKNFDYSQNLPIDALTDYIKNIWETIRNNKDINLPNEKEIVAQIRCEAIKKEALEVADPTIKDLQAKVQRGVCDQFNEIGVKVYKESIAYYEERADYVPKIVNEKLEELKAQLLSQLYTLFVQQISQAKNLISESLDKSLAQNFSGGILANLKQLNEIKDYAKKQYNSILINSQVVTGAWDLQVISDEFDVLIDGALDSKFGSIISHEFGDNIDNSVVLRFNEFGSDFWVNLQQDYDQQVDNLVNKYIPTMNFAEIKAQSQIVYFKNYIFQTFEHKLKEKLLSINDNMVKKFQRKFRYNKNETPENWRAMEESHIEDKFKECKNDVLEILNIFKFNKIQPENKTKSFNKFNSVIQEPKKEIEIEKKAFDDSDFPRLLNEVELNKIKQEFDKQISEEMATALRAKNQTDILGIPKAVWLLLIFFGYDDILRWLANPFFMTPIVMVLGAIALAFSTGNQQFVYTGFKLANAFVSDKVKQYIK